MPMTTALIWPWTERYCSLAGSKTSERSGLRDDNTMSAAIKLLCELCVPPEAFALGNWSGETNVAHSHSERGSREIGLSVRDGKRFASCAFVGKTRGCFRAWRNCGRGLFGHCAWGHTCSGEEVLGDKKDPGASDQPEA